MMPLDVIRQVPDVLPDSLRWTRWGCIVTRVSGALTFALVCVQHQWRVLHQHYLPFVILITIFGPLDVPVVRYRK